MKQVIEWNKLPKNLDKLENRAYLFKASPLMDIPSIMVGRLWWESMDMDYEYCVFIAIERMDLRLPISYFTHYAEVEG